MADSVIAQKTSNLEPYNKQIETGHLEPYNKQIEAEQSSKLKTMGFALLIIAGIGGVTALTFGSVGLASSPAWIVSVIGKEGCLTLIIGGAVIGGVGIGGGTYGLKKKSPEVQEERPQQPEEVPQVQPKQENLYQDKFVFGETKSTVKVKPVSTINDQISAKLPKLHYTYISTGFTLSFYDFYSKDNDGVATKKENLTFDQVIAEIDALGDEYDGITQADLALDT